VLRAASIPYKAKDLEYKLLTALLFFFVLVFGVILGSCAIELIGIIIQGPSTMNKPDFQDRKYLLLFHLFIFVHNFICCILLL
jgi:hypothetical protein